jgi:hypothetical protein
MVNIACTRCTEAIYTRYREEKVAVVVGVVVVAVEENSGVCKEAERRSRNAQ